MKGWRRRSEQRGMGTPRALAPANRASVNHPGCSPQLSSPHPKPAGCKETSCSLTFLPGQTAGSLCSTRVPSAHGSPRHILQGWEYQRPSRLLTMRQLPPRQSSLPATAYFCRRPSNRLVFLQPQPYSALRPGTASLRGSPSGHFLVADGSG